MAKHFSQLPIGSLTTMPPKATTVAPLLAYTPSNTASTPSVSRVSRWVAPRMGVFTPRSTRAMTQAITSNRISG